MSGGSFGYLYSTMRYTYIGHMEDRELDSLMMDLCELLHDLEWYVSGDTDEENYRESVRQFKNKWLGGKGRNKRLREIIEISCEELKQELIEMIGEQHE